LAKNQQKSTTKVIELSKILVFIITKNFFWIYPQKAPLRQKTPLPCCDSKYTTESLSRWKYNEDVEWGCWDKSEGGTNSG